MRFKPALIPTLFTIPAVAVLIFLGTWQLVRLEWKNNLVAMMNQRVAMEAVDVPAQATNMDEMQYRKVKVVGEFLHDKEVHLFVGAKQFKGRMGYDILTPMRLKSGDNILVDRGWVPYDKKEREKRSETLLEGVVEVEGMLHKGEVQKGFTPDNDINKNLWFWIDVPSIEKYTGLQMQNFYIRALKNGESNSLPIAGDVVIRHRNDHLQYAVTWYSLAIVLVVIYGVYHFKRRV